MVHIPYAKIQCAGNELDYVKEVIQSGWLTTAGKAAEFEKRFAEAVGASYACAVNSCTAALHLALEALGIGPGHKVLVPTLTFTATAEVIRYLGADPVFLDVEYGTNLLSTDTVREGIKRHPEVKAVIPVHFGGHPVEMISGNGGGLVTLCQEHDISIIEDAAHAFPTRLLGRMVGSFGDVTCFSFYANKTITTGEGGMLTTENEEVHQRVKVMRLHGINRDIWNRFTAEKPNWEYDVVAPGFKYNMPDINAAIGLAQLEQAHEFRLQRERCARFYFRELAGVPCLDLPVCTVPLEDHSWHLFPIVLNELCPLPRNRFIELLSERGIGVSVHYKPLHHMTYYRERYGLRPEDFPNAERTWRGCVSLPIYPALSESDLAHIVSNIKHILSQPAA